jgi:hypothetical protein
MLTKAQAAEIIQALRHLPAGNVREVRDFALFLKERSRREQPVNESDEWTDEDIRDFLAASLDYADEAAPWEGPGDH